MVCNAENAAGGSGLTIKCHEELAEAGVDVFTLGDHAYRKDEVFTLFERSDRLLRAANYPHQRAWGRVGGGRLRGMAHAVGVFTLMGRTFMKPVDDPFRAADRVVWRSFIGPDQGNCGRPSTPRRQATNSFSAVTSTAGSRRCSALIRTFATADEQILPNGTAYQTDVGMTGPYDSILGRRYDRVLASTLTNVPHHFDVATGDPRLCGALVSIDPASGRAIEIRRVSVNQEETQRLMTGGQPS